MNILFRYQPALHVEIPDYITNNLKFTLRPYQKRSLENHLFNTNWKEDNPPAGFEPQFNEFWPQNNVRREIYNMATGSGKTLVMAALMLELYKQGKRNFLFFVHTTSIIKKTKINFLHRNESKYLFAHEIMIDGNEVFVNEVESFDEAAPNAINIKFMTIGKLHSEWTQPRENGLDFETFNDQDVVFIADEYHHYHAATKAQGESSGTSWEEVVAILLDRNSANVYLGFTATLDDKHKALQEKLAPNIVFKYDLREFRNDKYSKEIQLFRSNMELSDRVLMSLLLSTYRSALAADNDIELKPVILFKSRTKAESYRNQELFHELVDNLNTDIVANIKGNCDKHPPIAKAFSFFDSLGWSNAEIANAISTGFSRENVLCMNEDKELEANQILVNTLENTDNPIRAVFAVDKLNEGWDVLTLFDIVRMFEGTGKGATPVAEAQLIGRGARLFAYEYLDLEPDKRKFDDETDHDFRVLEELYYHSFEDREYVNNLKKELSASGLYEDPDTNVICTMTLKPEFLNSEFYQTGKVVYNDKRIKSRNNIVPFNQLRVSVNNHRYRFKSQHGQIDSAFGDTQSSLLEFREATRNIGDLIDVYGREIIQRAIDGNPFFNFGPTSSDDENNISTFYPDITGMDDFLDMLFTLSIDFEGTDEILRHPFDKKQLLEAFEDLLASIESDIRSHLVLYEGTDWTQDDVTVANLRDVFLESKELSIPEGDERTNDQQEIVADATWFVYDSNFGTPEEKAWVRKFNLIYNEHQWKFLTKFEFVYMIRNEEWLRIVNRSNGEGFKPDYVLFCKEKDTEVIHQVFLEPKGEGFRPKDPWKETLLQGLRKDDYSGTSIEVDDTGYLISGTDLYTYTINENEIETQLLSCLSLPDKGDVNVETLKAVCADLELPNDSDDKDELIGILNEYPNSDIVEEDSIPDWDELSPRKVREIIKERPELKKDYDNWRTL